MVHFYSSILSFPNAYRHAWCLASLYARIVYAGLEDETSFDLDYG